MFNNSLVLVLECNIGDAFHSGLEAAGVVCTKPPMSVVEKVLVSVKCTFNDTSVGGNRGIQDNICLGKLTVPERIFGSSVTSMQQRCKAKENAPAPPQAEERKRVCSQIPSSPSTGPGRT